MNIPGTIEDLRQILDSVYVPQDDCKSKTNGIEGRIKANEEEMARQGKDLALTRQDVSYFKGLMKIIATTGIGTLLLSVLNLILK